MDSESFTELTNYSISAHAEERYAERIMGKDNMPNVRQYINSHHKDIATSINKLITYGDLLYQGDLNNDGEKQVFIKDYWIVLADPRKKKVITLFRIDLYDEEVNELFVSKMTGKINKCKEELDNEVNKADDNVLSFQNEIEKIDEELNYHKSQINYLETTKSSLNDLASAAYMLVDKKKYELKNLIETFVGRKVF